MRLRGTSPCDLAMLVFHDHSCQQDEDLYRRPRSIHGGKEVIEHVSCTNSWCQQRATCRMGVVFMRSPNILRLLVGALTQRSAPNADGRADGAVRILAHARLPQFSATHTCTSLVAKKKRTRICRFFARPGRRNSGRCSTWIDRTNSTVTFTGAARPRGFKHRAGRARMDVLVQVRRVR